MQASLNGGVCSGRDGWGLGCLPWLPVCLGVPLGSALVRVVPFSLLGPTCHSWLPGPRGQPTPLCRPPP